MPIDIINPSQKFEANSDRLIHLSDECYALYEELQKSLKVMRNMGIPTIGNPVLRLENKVLTLVYRTMQHQINCELYSNLIVENSLNNDLQVQLNGLYEMTDILSVRYFNYLTEWKKLEYQQKERVIEINKLSNTA